MSDSKKSSDEESVLGKIISAIEEVDKIDKSSKSSNEKKDKSKKSKSKTFEEEDFDDELPLTSKADDFLSDDSKRKFPILSIIGSVVGIVFIGLGIYLMLFQASERVVDSVASGETGTYAIFAIFLGIVIIGVSLVRILAKSGPMSNALSSLSDLTLLDEDVYYEKSNEENKLNKPVKSAKSNKTINSEYSNKEDEISKQLDSKQLDLEELTELKEDKIEDSTFDSTVDSPENSLKDSLDELSKESIETEEIESTEETESIKSEKSEELKNSDEKESEKIEKTEILDEIEIINLDSISERTSEDETDSDNN